MAYINVSESSEFTANVKRPQDLIDGVTAASLLASVQPLTNRSKWLYDLVVGGVQRVRHVANVAAMQALTVADECDVCAVVDPPGVFFYSSAVGANGLGPLGYAATGAGSGTWLSTSWTGAGAALGLATLDANSRVSQVSSNGIVWIDAIPSMSGTAGTSGAAQIGTTATVSKSSISLDRILVSGSVKLSSAVGVISQADNHLQLQYAFDGGAWNNSVVGEFVPQGDEYHAVDVTVPFDFMLNGGQPAFSALSFRWYGYATINTFSVTCNMFSVTCIRP